MKRRIIKDALETIYTTYIEAAENGQNKVVLGDTSILLLNEKGKPCETDKDLAEYAGRLRRKLRNLDGFLPDLDDKFKINQILSMADTICPVVAMKKFVRDTFQVGEYYTEEFIQNHIARFYLDNPSITDLPKIEDLFTWVQMERKGNEYLVIKKREGI